MNPRDAPHLPISTELNLHPLPRRQGLMVLRSEVEEVLSELQFAVPLPEGRLVDAFEVERLLAESGLTPAKVQMVNAVRGHLDKEVAKMARVDDEVCKAALAAFDENAFGATRWLTEPALALQGRTPSEVADTEEGKAEVILALRRRSLIGIAKGKIQIHADLTRPTS
jgi:uncharacterized protein (DUF2384 family)